MGFSLKLRLALAGILVAASIVGYAFLALAGQQTTSRLLRETLSRDVGAMHLAAEIKHSFVSYDDLIFHFLATGDGALLEESRRTREKIKSSMSRLGAESGSPTVQELLVELRGAGAVYFKDVEKLIVTAPHGVTPGDQPSFFQTMGWARQLPAQQRALGLLSAKGRTRLALVYALCDKLVDLSRVRMEDAQSEIRAALERGEMTTRWGGAAIFIGSALVGLFLAFSTLVPLQGLQSGIRRVMGGELDFEIPPRGAEEIARITQAFNAMTRRLREKEARLIEETLTDELTGLRNFRHFQEELKTETARAHRYHRPLSLFVVDIDHFKNYNDAYGHEMGNVVLKTLAQALREALRPSDLLARYGGEEFVALLPETDETHGRQAAERLREAIAAYHFPGEETQPGKRLTVSVGGACFPKDAQTAQDLVLKADKALYRAKSFGRNRSEWA